MTVVGHAMYSKYSYRGKPDLGLTLALVQAGGGAGHFNSAKLFRVLTNHHPQAEMKRLQRAYGKAKVAAFMQTMTFAINDLAVLMKANHIEFPDEPSVDPHDGRSIVLGIYQDGIAKHRKYDCGYMMEHLMSHPLHVVLMRDINDERGHGPTHNANFHIILTRVVKDLMKYYG